MARILVRRPKGMRVTILREELLRFFDWRHCHAHIAHCLERKTAAAMEAMEDRGEAEGLLWIQVTEESLYEDMLRAFSTRTIREALKEMEACGVIVCAKESIGKVKSILYNYDLVDQCVNVDTAFKELQPAPPSLAPPPPEKFPVAYRKNFRAFSAEFPKDGGAYNLKEVTGSISGNTPPTPSEDQPQRPASEIDYQSDPVTLIQNLYSRLNRRAKLPNLRARQHESLCENIRRADTEWGRADFQPAIEAYLADQSDWLREKQWPLPAFLKQVRRYIPNGAAPAPRPARAAALEDVTRAEIHADAPRAPQAIQKDFPARWNELVPERPVDPALLPANPRAYREPVFAERFDVICAKARALIVDGADLTFDFLLKTDRGGDGQYRWQQLLGDSLNWMRPRAKTPKQNGEDFLERKRREINERRKAADRARAADPGTPCGGTVGAPPGIS
jgi:hypothetical protein